MQQRLQIRAQGNIGHRSRALACAAIIALACSLPLAAQVSAAGDKTEGTPNTLPTILNKVGVDQNINRQLPLNAAFTDETGKAVTLGDYFPDATRDAKADSKKPAVLALVYYTCPMLCSEELEGLTSSLEMVRYKPGKDFNVIVVSIDPSDTPALAAKKKAQYLKRYGYPETAVGWHFLTGTAPNIDALVNTVGFHYVKVPGPDGKLTQFAHTSAIEVVTSQGRLAQYFYGVEYSPKDLMFALSEASGGKVGSPVEAMVLYCYHYDPHTGHYSLVIARLVQLACLATVFLLGGFMIVMFRKDARQAREVRELEAMSQARDTRDLAATSSDGKRNG
jgi:protein SCO1/2